MESKLADEILKLELKPGDILVMRGPYLDAGKVIHAAEAAVKKNPALQGTPMIWLNEGEELESVSETRMESLGWVRKEKISHQCGPSPLKEELKG